ncbi:MAG: sugar transferase [Nanoarchaeota archaeon]
MATFYIKKALGKDGELIKVAKFRTMVNNAENNLEDLINSNGFDEIGKIKNDPRVTKIGRVLRKYWIDELPQIPYNLLYKRDMKLVGIRPKFEEIWKRYPNNHKIRALKHKPGFMGILYTHLPIAHLPINNVENIIKTEEAYLDSYEINPFKTDLKYFLMLSYIIIFKGLRSR